MDDELLAVELVPSMRERLERLIAEIEENPHSNISFYSVLAYMDALIDIKVFPIQEINAARSRVSAAIKKPYKED